MSTLDDITPGTWTLDPDATDVRVDTDSVLLRHIPVKFRLHDATIEMDEAHLPSTISATISGPRRNDKPLALGFVAETAAADGMAGELTVGSHHVPVTLTVTKLDADEFDADLSVSADLEVDDISVSILPRFLRGHRVTVTIETHAHHE